MPYKLDTETEVFFYEQEFYCLSNFSAFQVEWRTIVFPTLEHAYHWAKFPHSFPTQKMIYEARSAHDALRLAREFNHLRLAYWNEIKVELMLNLMRAKYYQHVYVRTKLAQTGTRTLIEDSWRDDFWGWGPNKDGENMCGKLWMQIREETRS